MTRLAAGLIFIVCVLVTAATAGGSQQQVDWNGTWVGNWQHQNGMQIIFAGNEFIGMYWDGDYLEGVHPSASQAGKVMTLTWHSGNAMLTRDAGDTAHIVIHEKGKPDVSFALKRDH